MSIKTALTSIFDRKSTATSERAIGKSIARKSSSTYFGSYYAPVLARAKINTSYMELTEEILNTLPAKQVRDLVRKANPMVAKAQADFADAVASGYNYTVDKLMDETIGTPQYELIEDFFLKIEQEQGGIDTLIEEMGRNFFDSGAAFTELVIDKDGRTPVRLKTLDPNTAVFVRSYDEVIGEFYELGQDMGFGYLNETGRTRSTARRNLTRRNFGGDGRPLNFVSFHDDPTIKYTVFQSESNDPYGVPILDPAISTVIMISAFLSVFRDSLDGNLFPPVHITIDKQKFAEYSGVKGDQKKLSQKLSAAINDVQTQIESLKPAGALMTSDDIQVQTAFSAQGKTTIGSLKDIQDVMRRDIIVGTQSQPVLMGSNESVTETHALSQRISWGKMIRSAKKPINSLLTGYINLILELKAYPNTPCLLYTSPSPRD